MFNHSYRRGLTPGESEVIRALRKRGFAIVLLGPQVVGGPLNRKAIEDQMLKAARKAQA
jgi:hypothetical protein